MKFTEIKADPYNGGLSYYWSFRNEDNRPCEVRIKDGQLKLWFGMKGKKFIHDAQFYEVWGCKLDKPQVIWEDVERILSNITITIDD